jgi:hypothetical protein
MVKDSTILYPRIPTAFENKDKLLLSHLRILLIEWEGYFKMWWLYRKQLNYNSESVTWNHD